jgi:hypothetical protein
MTTLLQRHEAKINAIETLEADIRAAVKAWLPAGKKAREAALAYSAAERRVAETRSDTLNRIEAISRLDLDFGTDLGRRFNAGQLDREHMGEGGGDRISALLKSDAAYRKAQDAVQKTKDTSSKAHAESNKAWGDVNRAAVTYGQHTSFEVYAALARKLRLGVAPPYGEIEMIEEWL